MPIKFMYTSEQLIVDFQDIVVALQLIVALTLWVWLYVVALLLTHLPTPVYFD